MAGTLRHRKGRFEAQVYVGRDERGKRRYLTRTLTADDNRTGRRQAERLLAELVVEADKRRDEILNPAPVDATATLAQLLELWYEARESSWSPTAAQTARIHIDRYLTPGIGHRPVGSVAPQEIETLYHRLGDSGGREGRPLAASTVSRVHTTLRSAFGQAERWGVIDVNPMRRVTPPRADRADVHPPDPDVLARATGAARERNPMLYLYLVLAANTGARRGELVGLQWADIDAAAATVIIRRGVIMTSGRVEAKSTKTGRARVVAVTPSVLAELERWRRNQQTAALEQGVGRLPASGWVFAFDHRRPTPPRPDWATRAWTRLRADLGLDHVRLHDLRHFAATQLLGAGVDVGTVADRLGHSRASTTLDLYRHHLPQRDREAAAILGQIIDAGGES